MATEAEIAWAAGLFEGEGCISFNRAGGYMPKMTIVMTDEDVVARFQSVVERGAIHAKPRRAAHHKDQWAWRAHGEVAREVFAMLAPWLGERRRARGAEVFSHLSGKGPGGHAVTERASDGSAKRCTGCQEMKPLAAFSKSRHGIFGRESRCRECRRAIHRAYYVRARTRGAV